MNPDPFRQENDSPNPFLLDGESMGTSSLNPYAPTSHISETEEMESEVETFRRRYLAHEVSVKSIGLLYMIPGALFLTLFVVFAGGRTFQLMAGGSNPTGPNNSLEVGVAITIYGALGILQCYTGWGLRRFKRGARRLGVVFSGIGLILFPLGTIINGYFLYVLLGKKGKVVFSDDYQNAIRHTPHIKYRTSVIVKVFVGLLVVVFGLALVATLFGVS